MLCTTRLRFCCIFFFFFSSRRRHTRLQGDWSSDVCSSDLHQHPRHGSPPRSGSPPAPQPPPPGVSIRTTSPGSSSALTLGASAAPFKTVRPGAPEPPPAAPPGARRRRSARTLSSIGANASNSRTTPSPPAPPPPPPPPPRQPDRLTPQGYSISRTPIGVFRGFGLS